MTTQKPLRLGVIASRAVCESLEVSVAPLSVSVVWLGSSLEAHSPERDQVHGVLLELSAVACGDGVAVPRIDQRVAWAGLVVSSESPALAETLRVKPTVSNQTELETWLETLQPAIVSSHSTAFDGAVDERAEGRIIAIWGPLGSPGTTTLAITIAALLAQANPRVVLVDADTYGPGIALLLGIHVAGSPLVTAVRIARVAGATSLAILEGSSVYAARGSTFRVLGGLIQPEKWADIECEPLTSVLETLRKDGYSVVVDVASELSHLPGDVVGAPSRNGATRATLEAATDVVVVTRPTALHTQRLARAWPSLVSLATSAQVRVVTNGVSSATKAQAEEAAYALWQLSGIDQVHSIPLDNESVSRAEKEHVTLVDLPKKSPILGALQAVVPMAKKTAQTARVVSPTKVPLDTTIRSLWKKLAGERLP